MSKSLSLSAKKATEISKTSKSQKNLSPNLEIDKTTKTKLKTSQTKESKKIFQAIGVIGGLVAIAKEEQLTITIDGQNYLLGCTATSRQRYKALVEEIQSQGSSTKRVSVYPQIGYNRKQKSYKVDFNLVTIATSEETREGIFQDLAVGEFYLSGFWQYVPFCETPVIAVLRNYSDKLAQTVERVGTKKAKQLLKPNYIPVDWADSTVAAFKYNLDLEKKQQMLRYFVRVKAKFRPEKNYFAVIKQVEESTTQAPKYLK
ncbi:hypothetical protein [Myxosarcina sp. GI1]|uniref:hypothetical protein n=1 Tax=Myxosarcina sp. GI1 TaxID=1541065 RepID=UPI000561A779|nr:hypothetical protein [Myxosarcina sp. GI1]